jgi:riboflavin kinase/FMN adenylyltransferase
VVRGAQRGRELGFPTANVDSPPHTAIPADGVYAGWLVVDGVPLSAAISVGTNPTFDGKLRTVEAYAIGRTDLELYGEHVAVDFLARIRGQQRFESGEELIKRMDQDIEDARALIAAATG